MSEADKLARLHTSTAIRTLADIMKDSLAEDKDRIKASQILLETGHGKPTSVTIMLPAQRRDREKYRKLSKQQLLEVIQNAPVPMLPAPQGEPVDAEFTPTTRSAPLEVDPDDPLLQ